MQETFIYMPIGQGRPTRLAVRSEGRTRKLGCLSLDVSTPCFHGVNFIYISYIYLSIVAYRDCEASIAGEDPSRRGGMRHRVPCRLRAREGLTNKGMRMGMGMCVKAKGLQRSRRVLFTKGCFWRKWVYLRMNE